MNVSSNPAQPARIRLMSLNLRFGLAEDGPNHWRFRSRAYPLLLDRYPCDFYLFQEANDFQIDFLAHLLPEHNVIGRRSPAPERWQNNIIFFHQRWRCLMARHFYLSDTPNKESKFALSRWPRQCTVGEFNCGGRRLTCAVTHFDFDDGVQQRSARLIRRQLDELGCQDPTLLAGDFNCTPDSACYALLTRRCGSTTDRPFSNAFDPPPYAGTYHGFSGMSDAPPIDWILYRGDLHVEHAQVVERSFDGIYPSDHFPLIAEFPWSQA